VPGLAGIIGAGSPQERRRDLQRMVESMRHEPFYRSGVCAQEAVGLYAGWVCHQGSFSDCLPIWNEARDVCLLFSGEHFADRAEAEGLSARGHTTQGEDASYLVHMYEEMGTAFLQSLNGWFCGVVVDLRERKCVLFTDRYGLGRVYVHEQPTTVYFASEAKALLRLLPATRGLDPASLAEFFCCGAVLQNRTLFAGITLLPGGAMWTFSPHRHVQKQTYFQRDAWEGQPRFGVVDYGARLKETLARVLPRYFRSAGRVGISTTGGIDSRLILAGAPSEGRHTCYTFGGPYRDSWDVQLARAVAKACHRPHETIRVGPDFFLEFPALAAKAVYVSDGSMDVSGSVELYVNRLARGIAPIRLTGNYGSEILRGNIALRVVRPQEALFDSAFRSLLRSAEETYGHESQGGRLSFVAFKQVPWHHYARLAVEQSQLTLRSPYLDNELVALAYQAPLGLASIDRLLLAIVAEGNPQLGALATDRGLVSHPPSLTADIRRLLQELTFRGEYAYDYGMPQWLAKLDHALGPLHLETWFLGRHKFYHFRIWYRDQLQDYVKQILLDSRARSRAYFRGAVLEDMVTCHVRGSRNYTLSIHRALTSELIQRHLIEQD